MSLIDAESAEAVADWWDDECQDMFTDGFFQGARKLAKSVIDYARDVGLVPKDARLI